MLSDNQGRELVKSEEFRDCGIVAHWILLSVG